MFVKKTAFGVQRGVEMLSTDQVEKFEQDGFLLLENAFTATECDSLRDACHQIVEEMNPEEHTTVFTTIVKRIKNDDYFLNSGDKIRFFFEENSRDKDGKLIVDKQLALNKIGHALHILNPAFRKITFDDRIKNAAKSLGLVQPVVCQSMYIFKQPGIGGEVVPHQDNTFLHTDPMRLYGIWIALEDATEENGCLWFQPGSHTKGLYGNRRMVRNPNIGQPGEASTLFTCDPVKFDYCDYVPVEVKKGGMVLIHGDVVHKSEQNMSTKSRNIYTFHIFDQKDVAYSKENWLQQTEEVPFTPLYSTSPV